VEITSDDDLGLEKYRLRLSDWKKLEDSREILEVLLFSLQFYLRLTFNIRSLMHFRIFLVLKQHQLFVILFLLSHLSLKDGRNLQQHTMAGTQ
jgi:hypothetical protein